MRIGIYYEPANDPRPTGIGIHVRELVAALAEADDRNEYLLYYREGLFGNPGPLHRPEATNFNPRPVRAPSGWQYQYPRAWWDHYLPWLVARDRLDVFHGPNHYLPCPGRALQVVTIHDLAYFRDPSIMGQAHGDALRHWTRLALDRASTVITVSENTKRDVEELGIDPGRIRVVHGVGSITPEPEIDLRQAEAVRRDLGLPNRYILFVGTLQPRKNVPMLLRAYARLKAESRLPHKLVLVGQKSSSTLEVESLIVELGLVDDVVITGYVEAWHLPLIYKMADIFALPTLYEGFTMVNLEAMAYGVPIVATENSSIREGVGDSAILVPPDDEAGFARAIRSLLEDPERAGRLVASGRERANLFTWERCARETLAIYEDLARTPSRAPRLRSAGESAPVGTRQG